MTRLQTRLKSLEARTAATKPPGAPDGVQVVFYRAGETGAMPTPTGAGVQIAIPYNGRELAAPAS